MNHEKRVAVVTGAAQGIGRRVAEVLSGRGYRLALNDLRTPAETIQAIQSAGGEAIAHLGSVADQSVVEALARSVYDTWGRTYVLVNNAGVSFISPAEITSEADYRRVLDVNLVAPFLLAKTFGAKMLAARCGCIINVASVAGLVGIADRAALQCVQAWIDRADANPRGRMGWPGRAGERCLSGLGQNRNGRCRPGRWGLYGRGHLRPGAPWAGSQRRTIFLSRSRSWRTNERAGLSMDTP